jgi:hypothetical protein
MQSSLYSGPRTWKIVVHKCYAIEEATTGSRSDDLHIIRLGMKCCCQCVNPDLCRVPVLPADLESLQVSPLESAASCNYAIRTDSDLRVILLSLLFYECHRLRYRNP